MAGLVQAQPAQCLSLNSKWATVDDIASALGVSMGELAKRAVRLKR